MTSAATAGPTNTATSTATSTGTGTGGRAAAGAGAPGRRPGLHAVPSQAPAGPPPGARTPPAAPPRLAEREEPLARAAAMAQRARQGHGGVLLLTGAPGSGRSALLAAVAARQAAEGMTVLRARCSADESDSPYAAARQLFNPGARSRGLAARTPGATGLAALPPDTGHDPEADLWDLLLLHASHRPLLLAVDDVQLADTRSLRWLHQVCRRIDRLPVLLAVTEPRLPGPGAPVPGFARTLAAPLTQSCRIGPLGPRSAAQLAHRRLGAPVPRPLLDDCLRATGGNPLLLDALLTDLHALPATPDTLPATSAGLPAGTFLDAVDLWLHNAGPDAAEAARTLAQLAGHRSADPAGPAAELAELTGGDPGRLAGWLAGLTAQGLLTTAEDGRWPRFGHPLLREALLAGRPPARRAEVHRAAALLLHRRGDPDDLVAGHLLHTPAVGERWAADALLGAARAARREDRPQRAAELLRRALDEPLPTRRRGATLTELGCLEVALGAAGHAAGIRHLAEAVHLQHSDEGVFTAANALGAALAARGETAAALEVLEELAERFADREDLTRAVQAAAALISSHDGDSWLQVVEGLRRIARTPRIAPAARALLTEFDSTSGVLSAAEVTERVQELCSAPPDPFSQHYVLASAATLAQWTEQLPEADRLVREGMAAYRGPLLHPGYQCLLSVRAESRVMRGEYGRLLDECGLPDDTGDPAAGHRALLAQGNAHLVAQAVIALTESGRLAQARELARSAEAGGAQGSWEWNEYLYARGLLQLASGRPATALEDLLECGRRQRERQVESPIVTPWRSAAADCQVLLGLPGPAVSLATEELRLARIWGTPRTIGRAMRALGSATGGRQGLALAAEAVALLRDASVDTELIPALITHGRLLGAAGRRAAARQTLREAATRAERLGAVRLRSAAEDLLHEWGARPTKDCHTGAPALTGSEQRICRLAVAGHSNAEIAALLHLAVRTVETHLTNSFRKLGIRRRAELAGRFERPDPPPE
ncbi:AAA family ATPase [Kitasatospora sp. NPDC057223]|uniref:AAA family ATPase n=1 Tax=Kitasatospora sp. NPDC057223 TaxID=3346055 RepID=UPI003627EE6C